MNYKIFLKKFFVFLLLSIALIGIINRIPNTTTPPLIRLLKRYENHTVNTTAEKKLNRKNDYQIVDGKLYTSMGEGLTEYDYSTKKTKDLFDTYIPNTYQIINDQIYYCKKNDNNTANDMDLICRSLDGKNKKKILKNISDFFFCGDQMIFCRYNDTGEMFYLYHEEEEPQLLFVNEEYSEDGFYPAHPMFCREDNIIFEGPYTGYIAGYNLKTKQWQEYFNMCDTPQDRYYIQLNVQCIQNYMFVHGTMCSNTRTATGGLYYLDDAQENGVWQIDLITNERKQITQTVYSGGIYVLNDKLYGIDNGKYTLLYSYSKGEIANK